MKNKLLVGLGIFLFLGLAVTWNFGPAPDGQDKPETIINADIIQTRFGVTKIVADLGTGGGGVWGSITGTLSAQTDLQTALDAKAATSHDHDSRYYTETEADSLLSGKSGTGHDHSGIYEPVISKSTGYVKWTGSAWGFADEAYSLSSHNHSALYAPVVNGVTNGDSHDHAGGDGAQIAHSSLSGIGTNTHAQVDTHLASTSNPHSTTASQVGLGSVSNDSQLKRVDGDMNSFAQKVTPVAADILLIEDSAASYAKKKVLWSQLPAGGGATIGYTIAVHALTSSPTDAATVYFGMLPKAPTTTANISKVYIRKAGTIKIAEIYCYSGTAGTAEAWSLYIRKNNTTDYLVATLSVSTNERVFTNSVLNIAVVVGDYIEIKGIQPTWATNPLTTIYGGYVYIE